VKPFGRMISRADGHEYRLTKTGLLRINQRDAFQQDSGLFHPLPPAPARVYRDAGTGGQRFERCGGVRLKRAQFGGCPFEVERGLIIPAKVLIGRNGVQQGAYRRTDEAQTPSKPRPRVCQERKAVRKDPKGEET